MNEEPMDDAIKERKTYDDYAKLPEGAQYQLIGGEIIMSHAPDLVVEILSPTTGYYDLATKKYTCEAHGVKEYWVRDPKGKTIEICENVNGLFQSQEKERPELCPRACCRN